MRSAGCSPRSPQRACGEVSGRTPPLWQCKGPEDSQSETKARSCSQVTSRPIHPGTQQNQTTRHWELKGRPRRSAGHPVASWVGQKLPSLLQLPGLMRQGTHEEGREGGCCSAGQALDVGFPCIRGCRISSPLALSPAASLSDI